MSEKDQPIEISLNQQSLYQIKNNNNNNSNKFNSIENENVNDIYYPVSSDEINTVDNSNNKMDNINHFNSQNDNQNCLNGDNKDQIDNKQPQALIHEQNIICDSNQHLMAKQNSLSFINHATVTKPRLQDYNTSNIGNNNDNAQENSNKVKENTKDHCVDVQLSVINTTNSNQKNNFSQSKNNNQKIVDTKRSSESIGKFYF